MVESCQKKEERGRAYDTGAEYPECAQAQGLSQEALAEKIGVSRQALGKWEKDTALPGLDNLQALAAALGIGVNALLGAENADPPCPP